MGINNDRFNSKSGFSSKLAQSKALQAAIRESKAAYPEQFKNYSYKNQQYVEKNIKSSGVQYQQKPTSTSPRVTTYVVKPNTFDVIPKTTTVKAEQQILFQMPQSLGKLSSVYIAGSPNWKGLSPSIAAPAIRSQSIRHGRSGARGFGAVFQSKDRWQAALYPARDPTQSGTLLGLCARRIPWPCD